MYANLAFNIKAISFSRICVSHFCPDLHILCARDTIMIPVRSYTRLKNEDLLPDHVELIHVLDLAVHLVQLMTWMGRGGHTETFSLSELFP